MARTDSQAPAGTPIDPSTIAHAQATLRALLARAAPKMGLTAAAVDALTTHAQITLWRRGQSILVAGDTQDVAALVVKGAVRVVCTGPDDHEMVAHLAGPGRLIGVCSGATVGATGTCTIGPRRNQPCTTEGIVTVNSDNPPISGAVYTLSHDCPPGGLGQAKVATIPVDLFPLTTAASSLPGPTPCPGQTQDDGCGVAACTASCAVAPPLKGGVHQLCCANAQRSPCFPTKTGAIVRSGQVEVPTPAWPDTSYPKTGVGGASGAQLASIFCLPKTNSTLDGVTGLPGPGAVVLPVRQCWRKPGQACP